MPLNPRLITSRQIVEAGGLIIRGSFPFLNLEGIEASGVICRFYEISGVVWITLNARFESGAWLKDDIGLSSFAFTLGTSGPATIKHAPPGASVTWTDRFTFSAGGVLNINPDTSTAPITIGTNGQGQLVVGLNADLVDGAHASEFFRAGIVNPGPMIVGSDPGGTENIRSGSLRTNTAVVGTDPGGTEALRTNSLRASTLAVPVLEVVGADPGGTEVLRAQNFRTSSAVVGTDPGGTEVLRASSLRTNDAVVTTTAIVGTDPGGTEALRAGSARLQAPVLTGSVPQFTMAADPTAAMHVATKQYVDSQAGGGGGGGDIRFLIQGNAMVANKVAQVLVGTAITYTTLRAYADTAPAGAALNIRINKNGTSAATLSIPAGSNSASTAVSIAVTSGDRISLDITQVGSTTPGGNDLLVTLH